MARLANLPLKDSEIKKFEEQLSKVVDYIGELEQVDTKNTEPTSQTTGLESVTREDEIDMTNVLNMDSYFKVKAILNKNK